MPSTPFDEAVDIYTICRSLVCLRAKPATQPFIAFIEQSVRSVSVHQRSGPMAHAICGLMKLSRFDVSLRSSTDLCCGADGSGAAHSGH